MFLGLFNIKCAKLLNFTWKVNDAAKPDEIKNEKKEKRHPILKRRYIITLLGFFCSVVMHSQRLNVSIAVIAMVNSTSHTSTESQFLNSTESECPSRSTSESQSSSKRSGEFLWKPELQGFIISAGYLGYFLTQIPGGMLARNFGAKAIILAGLVIASLANLLSPVAAQLNPYALATVQLIRGMAQGIQQPSMSVLMSKWFPRSERGFLSAFIYSGYPMGAFIGSMASGALCELEFLGGWPLVFYVFGAVGLLVSAVFMWLYSERPADDPRISEIELQHILQNQEDTTGRSNLSTPWGAILTSMPTYALVIGLFGQYWMAFYILSVHSTFLGTVLNIPIKENGFLSSGPFMAQFVAGFFACWLAYTLNRTKSASINLVRKGCNTLSNGVFALGVLGVYLAGCDPLWNEACLFIATASIGFAFAGSLIVAVDMSPTYCGPLMGFASSAASLAGFIAPVIAGVLTNEEKTLAQWHKMFILTACIAAGTGIVFLTCGSTDVQPYDPASSKTTIQTNKEKENSSKVDVETTQEL